MLYCVGGPYGIGSRMKLGLTRAIIDAIHSGALRDAPAAVDPVFGLRAITACPNVPASVLVPRTAWADGAAYDATARKLAGLFAANFKHYAGHVAPEVAAAGPAA
ncbi:MAG: phosphoenolpyruvate carboxykinase (ATP) [Planctomycetia bacterium]